MKVLILTSLYPGRIGEEVQGTYRRLNMFIEAIANVAGQVEIIYFVHPSYPSPKVGSTQFSREQSEFWQVPLRARLLPPRHHSQRRWWHRIFAPLVYSYSYDPFWFGGKAQVNALKERQLSQYDMIFVHKLPCMSAVFQLRRCRLPPVAFDIDDVEHRFAIRSALGCQSWFSKSINLLKVIGIFLAERKAGRLSERLFVCSEYDRRHLQQLGFGNRVVTVPNAISVPSSCPPFFAGQTVLFLGFLPYRPNSEAAERLVSVIWPLVLRKCPRAQLIIAGKAPENVPSYGLTPKNVEFTGLVGDLDKLYRRTRLVCCPLSNGGGTRLKLIEAAAYGKAIVSTRVGAEGLSFSDGAEILIRDDDIDIAEACVRLLNDDGLCARLGEAARTKAKSLYDRPVIRDRIASEFRTMLRSGKKRERL
ncbi:MAG TPA: glycosyltransferase family 4 protein [Nitrospira sp.]|nr:glycosyltransferase family 4 protein [Nitrospira sp.]